jgi:CRISPR-associated endonuclease/helicase Cas3
MSDCHDTSQVEMRRFSDAFTSLTGSPPFPWQQLLYRRFIGLEPGGIPSTCNLPTGLGKTSVVALWLLALAQKPDSIPRRLVYVVNRRTVVDQTTNEVEKYRTALLTDPLSSVREQLSALCAIPLINRGDERDAPLALSTLRGQFADNREWSADPARPAVIVGTVDMIGSRLLFSGYGVSFKGRPLHAGFLGQDVLLVHDEAHLEPAFQKLLIAIEKEQCEGERTANLPWRRIRVMELSATARARDDVIKDGPFELTNEERNPPQILPAPPTEPIHLVWQRLTATKGVAFHKPTSEKESVGERIGKLAREYADEKTDETRTDKAILVFVSSLDDHAVICKALAGKQVQVLTGTLRGLERDAMTDPRKESGCPVFARFLKAPKPDAGESEQWKVTPLPGTVYLVCTSAGEVGIDISADHMICDLTAFDRMAQRFGRVNRFGNGNARIDIVHEAEPDPKKKDDPNEHAKWKTLELLMELPLVDSRRSASPAALMQLRNRPDLADATNAAYSPEPTILHTSDILFDAWSLTTIRGKLPGRPPVERYLHGISGWEPPETHVAWREEVAVISGDLLGKYEPSELLDEYPLKPHELLRDNSNRVFDRLKKLKADPGTPVWLVADDGLVEVISLQDLIDTGKDNLGFKTVILPPSAGGLESGLLTASSIFANDVADEVPAANVVRRSASKTHDVERRVTIFESLPRIRLRGDDERLDQARKLMRLIRIIDTQPDSDDAHEDTGAHHLWYWFESLRNGDTDGSKSNKLPVEWQVHTDDVTTNVERIVTRLLPGGERKDLRAAIILAAKFHDLGKRRLLWQRSIGNPIPTNWLAKSGGRMKPRELGDSYRHEFGSLLDLIVARRSASADLQQTINDFNTLSDNMQDVVLHLIAVHHGFGRPHFPAEHAFDPEPKGASPEQIAAEVPRRFGRLQRKYGRWGLAYLESLLRAADYAASANPSEFVEDLP